MGINGQIKCTLRLLAATDHRPFTFALAAWLRHVSGATHDCKPYKVEDPLAQDLSKLNFTADPKQLSCGLLSLGIIKRSLFENDFIWDEIFSILQEMLMLPMTDVICNEAR